MFLPDDCKVVSRVNVLLVPQLLVHLPNPSEDRRAASKNNNLSNQGSVLFRLEPGAKRGFKLNRSVNLRIQNSLGTEKHKVSQHCIR